LQLNANDVRARYGLAWVHAQHTDYAAALVMSAEAFSLDSRGESFERLLKKQQELLMRRCGWRNSTSASTCCWPTWSVGMPRWNLAILRAWKLR
jgi:hypothetical protein